LPESDFELIHAAALMAGEIAMSYFGKEPKQWDKGGGQGPVCEADLAIDEMLSTTFGAARSDYAILSEETEDDKTRCSADEVFIIDPIDGTRSFLNRHENFATSIAIARNGVVTEAVVHLPAKDLTYSARRGAGAWLNGEKIKTGDRHDIIGARILASGSQTRGDLWRDGPPPIERHFRSSLAYRLCLVAQGRFDGMMTLRPTWEWDVAAGDLICTEAGVDVKTQNNETPIYNSPDAKMNGMIAANAPLLQSFMAYL
jgi:myo-inositol-1(or 4)-monophosphatase